jgi:hypothetical protein
MGRFGLSGGDVRWIRANPAADMHNERQSGERRYLSEESMAQLKPTSDIGGIAAIDSGE